MRIRAAIFDIYNTVLKVEPPPADAARRWLDLWRKHGLRPPAPSLSDFDAHCQDAIAPVHAAARSRGIPFPEVNWAQIARAAAPGLQSLPDAVLDDFLFDHAQLERTVRMMPGAAETLRAIMRGGLAIGLCSNCQPYTLRELADALGRADLPADCFDPQLCFYSFRAGFSKPDPAVFEPLEQELARRGIAPAESLMVGDRLDNDIEPARSRGWVTWHVADEPSEGLGGDWAALRRFVDGPTTGR